MSCIEKRELAVPEEAVGMLMTYRCNLSCVYCYIKKKKNRDMSLAQAQAILEPVLMKPAGPVDIIFMGGETLMAINVIMPLVEWAENLGARRLFRFVGSTNGTLLTPEIKAWLTKHRLAVILGLSYDGVPEVQQQNRATGNRIDVDFFAENWPQQQFQMTVNEASVKHMAEGVIYLLEKGVRVHPNISYEEKEWANSSLHEYAKQLNILGAYYLKNQEKFHITAFQHNLVGYAKRLEQPTEVQQCCGAGNGFTVYDTDGSTYPCHILSPLVLEGEKLSAIQSGAFKQDQKWGDTRCYTCPFAESCSTCIASNYVYRNDFCHRDRTHCIAMQLEVQSYMKYRIAALKKKEVLTPKDASEVDAIKALHHFFVRKRAK